MMGWGMEGYSSEEVYREIGLYYICTKWNATKNEYAVEKIGPQSID